MTEHPPKLTAAENSLVEQTEPHALARLDEDALKDLQSQLRRARDKHFSLQRRRGAARVEAQGSRLPDDDRSGEKVEVFDEALERVAARLDAVGDE